MTDDRKREAPISYRPPEDLREEFRARALKSGLSVNAFITASIFGSPAPRQARRPAVEQRDLARLLAETARVSAQLQALAGAGHDPAALDAALRDLREIRAACLVALGRSP
ncbi:hypothetical protein [Sinorhizobium meliloti]|nr:hypothetical protein U8C39_09600 [Sinorhizobium meliloti]WQP31710.1 hypothetical protein U8C45_09565 [Sinorhizobium meliloti]